MHAIRIESVPGSTSVPPDRAAAARRPGTQERPAAWPRFVALMRHGRASAGPARSLVGVLAAPCRDLPLPPL